jgi:hypothetical protein
LWLPFYRFFESLPILRRKINGFSEFSLCAKNEPNAKKVVTIPNCFPRPIASHTTGFARRPFMGSFTEFYTVEMSR